MIDKETYKLTENNYHPIEYKKRQIIIGSSNRKDMLHYGSWVNRWNGKYKMTAPYTIDKNGKIFEHYDPMYYSDFINKEQDKAGIPILLTNEGWLQIDSMDNTYIDWLGNIYNNNDNDIIMKRWRNRLYWKKYPNEQMDSLKFLINKLCEDFNINKEVLPHNAFYEDVDLFDGIVYRSNYIEEVTDVTPAFNIAKIKEVENG